jgi:hypothetical protein
MPPKSQSRDYSIASHGNINLMETKRDMYIDPNRDNFIQTSKVV